MVVIFWPTAAEIGVTQERIASPPRCTVQAPHKAAPQPNLVPVMFRLSRSVHKIGVDGSASTCTSLPLIFKVIIQFSWRDALLGIIFRGPRGPLCGTAYCLSLVNFASSALV